MEFRPCIDIHNGKVKQIVGGSLKDEGDFASENFVSEQDAAFYAKLYQKYNLKNGHIILLNPKNSEYYAATLEQAKLALAAWPNGMQIGGGITADNAKDFLDSGASRVIVTSYVFRDGKIDMDNLQKLVEVCGAERLVLDLSCRKKGDSYYIVTDRWQKFTDVCVNVENMVHLSAYCSEFLIHAADVEGKANGVERDLVNLLTEASLAIEEKRGNDEFQITYAGGVGNFSDLRWLKEQGKDRIHVTIGSALDLFGGNMPFEQVVQECSS